MGKSCGACEDLSEGVFLCPGCRGHLIQNLAELDSTIAELRTTMARQDTGAPSHGSGSTTPQPAINLDALEAYEQLRAVIIGWAVALQGRAFYWITRTEDAGSYLLANIDLVRRQDWARELATELASAVWAAVNATDRAADKISLGHCLTLIEGQQCPDTITAIVGNAWGRCRTCGATANVAEHQQALMARAGHVRAPLGKLVRALRSAGHLPGVSLKRVENWVARGKLGPVIPFRALYTASDIMDAYLAAENYKADMAAHIARKKLTQVA